MRLLIAILLAFFLGTSSVSAWGPITHLEIAEMQGGTSNDYRAGAVLPDFSLAYRAAYDSTYPNLQSVTHSSEFRDALAEVASADFVAGWDSHLYADTIESPYSAEKIASGAPCGADYVVDQAYAAEQRKNSPELGSWDPVPYGGWIDYALDSVGCETNYPPSSKVDDCYHYYVGGYQPNAKYYREVLTRWYSDYQEYVDLSAFPPEPVPPEPKPKPNPVKRVRPWYRYEAPPERAEAERLKAEKWAEIDVAMRATDDIAEKLRLYAEWEIFRDAHTTPSIRA